MRLTNETINKIKEHNGDVFYRWGFGYKGAEWVKTTKEDLIEQLNNGGWAHYEICTKPFGINFYTCNDMY